MSIQLNNGVVKLNGDLLGRIISADVLSPKWNEARKAVRRQNISFTFCHRMSPGDSRALEWILSRPERYARYINQLLHHELPAAQPPKICKC